MQSITQSLSQGLGAFFSYIPQLIGALVILIVGYIIAKVLQAITTRVLQSMGFQGWMEKGGIKQFFDRANTRQTPASIMGKLVFWFVFIITITMAADALGIRQVSQVLAQLIAYIPSIIAAVLILVLAALLASFLSGVIRGATGSGLLARIAQYAIIIYAAFAALTELGIAVTLTAPTFLIVLGAVALAAAIAFGWGARNVAQDIVEKAYNRRGEVTGGGSSGDSGGGGDRRGREGGHGGGSASTADGGRGEGRDLVKMSESDFVLEDRRHDLRGRSVYDREDNEIGKVEDLYADADELRVRFLAVSAGGTLGLGKKHFLIPYEAVTGVGDDRVTLDRDRDSVTDAPDFDEESRPDRGYQREVYRHYGLA